MKHDLIVVGIGASAGGLEAINEFFDYVGDSNGMAYVVVQHLSPDFKSMMNELLAKHTNMPIQVVNEKKSIRSNHIYLIDKDSQIIIKNGSLVPIERDRSSHLNLPIDEFFHSLGKNYKKRGVGIILSGTGTDGSRGIRTLKENGGLIFAQEPESARFDGMPRSAIITGLVDKVLTPRDMAESLRTLASNGYAPKLKDHADQKETESGYIKSILDYIHINTGIDFKNYRKTTILRRIEKRIFITDQKDLPTYAKFVENNQEEIETLHKEFLIGVTCFFRDKEAFEIVREKVIPDIFQQTPEEEPVRIWVPGCSSGEEAYSIAIMIEEYFRQTNQVRNYKIFATDLDSSAILTANLGIYNIQIEEDIIPETLDRYFEKTEDGKYKILKTVRENIVFSVHDSLNDPPFINMDLISCRNFLIYLNSDVQQDLLGNFQFALKFKGYLFLGPSESLGKMKNGFSSIDDRWNIYQNIAHGRLYPPSQGRRKHRSTSYTLGRNRNTATANKRKNLPFRLSGDSYSRMLIKRYVPTCMIVDDQMNLLYANGDVDEFLQFPYNPADLDLANMVESDTYLVLKNGVTEVVTSKKSHLYKDIELKKKERKLNVDIAFEPLKTHIRDEVLYLIEIIIKDLDAKEKSPVVVDDEVTLLRQQMRMLEMELKVVKEEEISLKERLETTNEELQTANEELLAANEELQSTNEELQSVNEELYSVNTELQTKVSELTLAYSDMDNLMRSTELGTIYVDKEMKIRRFTPAIARQFDFVQSDIGRPVTAFGNTIRGTNVYEDMVLAMKENTKVEKEITDDDGNDFLMRIVPYKVENRVEGAIATFIDISDTKAAKIEVQSLANQFKAVFNNSSEVIAIYSRDGLLIDVNQVPEGYDKKNSIGQHLHDLAPPDALVQIKNAFKKAVKEKRTTETGMYMTMPNGDLRWFNVLFIPVFKNDKIDKILTIARDETQLRNIEKEIRLQANIFSSIYQFAGEHIVIMDNNGVVQDINYTDAGFKKQDLLGKSLIDAGPKHLEELVTSKIRQVQNTRSFVTYETDFDDDLGVHRYYSNNLMPILADGQLQAMVLLARDITDIKNAEAQLKLINQDLENRVDIRNHELQLKNKELESMNSFMDSFVHGAAHDLRSPLTNIKGFLELLPDITDKQERTEIMSELTDAVHRMERVLAGLIELIDFQKTEVPLPRKLNVLDMVNQAINDINPYLQKARGHVKFNIDPDLYITYIEAYLSSVLYNLLHNSVKYRSYERPLTISVSAKREDDFIYLTILDNGIGMDLRRYGHFLFKPFKRLTLEREGTGIGLSIINKVVKRNGGYIEVESELNKGTTFHVFFKEYES